MPETQLEATGRLRIGSLTPDGSSSVQKHGLADLRHEFELSKSAGGPLVASVNVGAIAAWLLVRSADRWGRLRLLAWTIGSYTLSTVASSIAPDATSFGLAHRFSPPRW